MPYKSKEKAWICFMLSIIAFWFKGGIIFICLIWGIFFFIELPRDMKELKKYNRYLKQQGNSIINNSKKDEATEDNSGSQVRFYSDKEKELYQNNKELDVKLKKVVDDMNEKFGSK